MYMVILTLHIAVAAITTAASVGAIITIVKQSFVRRALQAMWGSFAATAASGVVLVVMQPHLLAHTCVMMSLYVAITGAIQLVARRVARQHVVAQS